MLAGLLLRNTIGAMVAAYIAWEIPSAVVLLLNGPIHIPPPATVRIACRAGCPGVRISPCRRSPGTSGTSCSASRAAEANSSSRYLPASRYWTEQLIQGGLFLAIAVTTLGAAIWLLHRRTT